MLGRILKIALLSLLPSLALGQTIPAGAHITVRLNSAISSGRAQVGQVYNASLTHNLEVKGRTVARAGAPARVKVTYVKASGRLHDPGRLSLRLASVEVDGRLLPVASSTYQIEGKSHKKGNVEKIGGGAAAGALIGALAGGGKGALIGTAVGAGAGTGVAAATGKEEAELPAEAAVSFTTTRSLRVK